MATYLLCTVRIMTSNSVNYSIDRDTLIRAAFETVGIGVDGEDLQPEEITTAARRLNTLIKHWAVHGFKLWKRERQSITLVASQASYTIGQKAAGTTTATTANKLEDSGGHFVNDVSVGDTALNTTDSTSTTVTAVDSTTVLSLAADIFTSGENYEITTADVSMPRPDRIIECDRVDSSNNTISISPLSLQEYENLPNKVTTGTPIQYFYDPLINNGKIYFWQTPSTQAAADYTIDLVAMTQVHDMDTSTDLFDFPQEWYEPLILSLGYELGRIYGGLRLGEMQIMKADAKEALNDAIDFQHDGQSVFFQPDLQGYK